MVDEVAGFLGEFLSLILSLPLCSADTGLVQDSLEA